MEVAAKLRVCIEAKGGKAESLFDVISGDDSGELTQEEIRSYLQEHMCEIEPAKLDMLFPDTGTSASSTSAAGSKPSEEAAAEPPLTGLAALLSTGTMTEGSSSSSTAPATAPKETGANEAKAEDAEGGTEEAGKGEGDEDLDDGKSSQRAKPRKNRSGPLISRDHFMRIVRIFYKVVKDIVLSDNLLIDQSQQIRRMDIGEVVEVFQGPMLDPSVGVYRIHGRALKDGVVGWVTVAGNQGITFLLPGGNVFKVVSPVELTKDVKDIEGQEKVRMLKEGEILEVMEWARTSSSALGVSRIRAKAQDDGAVGWATTADSSGAVYLEAT